MRAPSRSHDAAPSAAGTGVGVIERERPAVVHDLLATDEHMPDRPLAGCIEQAADRIVKRLHRRVFDVDHEKICSGARRHPPEIIAAKRAGAADVAAVKISAAPTACAWPAATRAKIAAV